MPDNVRAAFAGPVPVGPQLLSEVYAQVATQVIPYAMGNIHPRFWAWYMGAGNLTGALADFLAAIDGSNLGGADSAASLVDRPGDALDRADDGLSRPPARRWSAAGRWPTSSG
jgi:aromatic-L-amino-acid/L-tryptophan decarboxylase